MPCVVCCVIALNSVSFLSQIKFLSERMDHMEFEEGQRRGNKMKKNVKVKNVAIYDSLNEFTD